MVTDLTRSEHYPLSRREVVQALVAQREDLLVIAGLGAAAWDVTAAGDHACNFPMWGAMGGACMVGLGLALAQPRRRVLVVTGDGEMLMGLGGLATVAVQGPPNLAIVVLDNERYGETGMQVTHTAYGTELEAVAAACGFARVALVRSQEELEQALAQWRAHDGLFFCNIKVRAEDLPFALPPKDGAYLKDRFRHAVLGAAAAV